MSNKQIPEEVLQQLRRLSAERAEAILYSNMCEASKDNPDIISNPSFEDWKKSGFGKNDLAWTVKAMEEYAALHPPQRGSAEEQIVTDLILIMEENRAAMVNAKINKWNDVLKSNNPFDCVIETYDDLISIIKNLPLKRAKNEEGLFDYLNSPAPQPSGEAGGSQRLLLDALFEKYVDAALEMARKTDWKGDKEKTEFIANEILQEFQIARNPLVGSKKEHTATDVGNAPVEFAEWVGQQGLFNGISPDGVRRWHKFIGNESYTTAELFQLFKQSQVK